MLFLAAFQSLLFRYSGQADISVGTPIANRNRPEIEGLIGFFVNTLVIRTVFSKDSSFSNILKQVRENSLGAYAYQDIPFEMLVDEIQPERDLSHTPLFQAMFLMQNISEQAILLPELKISTLDMDTKISMFDITLVISEMEDGFFAGVEYNVDLFERTSIERMMNHFERLLEDIVRYPERTPEAIAVISGNETVTYDELNRRANQLAHYLRSQGIGPEALVGVSMDRSTEMMVGLLGILKAGGAYVPLDPSYPSDRLSYVIKDANVRIILTNERVGKHITNTKTQIITVDSDWERISQEGEQNPTDMDISAGNLAYVIYTSGSTGVPKGVMVEHQSVVNHNFAVINDYEITPEDRVLQFATINFDTAVEEIFPTWLAGATLVLRNDDVLLSAEELKSLVETHGITVLNLPTAYWHEWVYELLITNQRLSDSLRLVVIGGEKCLKERYENYLQVGGDACDWLNTYGPTEATIISSLYEPQAELDQLSEVPIGRPIANTRLYILDEYLHAVPVGVRGELCIGGDGVTRGYLNSSISTAKQFVPDPYSVIPGSRMYRTGDLVRYLPDGNIEFSGRVDHQVKVRGFRIEINEIEAVLEQYETIREAVAWVREDDGIKKLIGYIVPDHLENPPIIVDIREYLGNRLPEFMIPTAFVILDELPLKPNGKVDRNALPEPEFKREDLGGDFVAPSNKEEDILVEIWEKVLGTPEGESIGVHDNFFELGGDSILSIQIIARANQAGISITPKDMFEAQTIYKLAKITGREKYIHAEQGVVTGSVPLTPIQHNFFGQELINPHHWNQVLMLDIRSEEDSDAKKREEAVRSQLDQALRHVLIHHDVLRMRFEFDNSSWTQSNADVDENIQFEWVDMSVYEKGERIKIMEEISADYQSTLDINKGPLIRVVYFDFGTSTSSCLLFIIHHLAVDGISWRIILEDFQTAFLQLQNNVQVSLPQKTTSYQYWAQILTDYSRTEEIKHDLDYWVETTKFSNPSLPLDHSNGDNFEESVQNIRIVIDREDTLTLLQEVPKAYNTEITDVLLTALVMTFNKWTRASSLFVNLEGHGREDITIRDTEYVQDKMRIDGIGEALVSIKEQLRKIPNRGFTYGILRYLGPWADELLCDVDGKKLFVQPQVSFNFLGKVDEGMINPSSGADTDQSQNLFLGLSDNNFGPVRSPIDKREHLIDIISSVTNGQLLFEWIFSENYHKRETIQELVDSYVYFLHEITTHCLSRESVAYTPSDFEDVDMDQEDLDAILDELGEF
jgi:amino acid adenylation domain-containing protein/non-ribosomal peptide synthase protein (TIGR01720 family)